MWIARPRTLLTIITVSLLLVAAPEAFTQQYTHPPKMKTVPSVKATPIEIPGKGKPVVVEKPSVKATPIEIPGKGKPVVVEKPSVKATPIEIPGKGKPVVKMKP